MVYSSELDPEQSTDSLKACNWQHLFRRWQAWLQAIDQLQFQPGWTSQGYTVIGWGMLKQAKDIQDLLNRYYTVQLNQRIRQLRHQLSQNLIFWKIAVQSSHLSGTLATIRSGRRVSATG